MLSHCFSILTHPILTSNKKPIENRLSNLLYTYIQQGKFPKNKCKQQRKPCIIDEAGNICAVGYLL